MKARIKWVEGVSFVAETGSGHAVVIDGAPEPAAATSGSGRWSSCWPAPRPARHSTSCWILKKARQPVADCVVEAEAERAPSEPKVFTRIHLTTQWRAAASIPRQVERAVKLSKEKYCSATLMLAPDWPRSPIDGRSDHRRRPASTSEACSDR